MPRFEIEVQRTIVKKTKVVVEADDEEAALEKTIPGFTCHPGDTPSPESSDVLCFVADDDWELDDEGDDVLYCAQVSDDTPTTEELALSSASTHGA